MKVKGYSLKVQLAEKIGYSMGDGAANLAFQMMMMFQMFFYTDVFGIKDSFSTQSPKRSTSSCRRSWMTVV